MWNTVNRGKVHLPIHQRLRVPNAAVKQVYSNTYLRLIDMCAIMLLAVQEEIADARSEVGGELQFPIARLVESFSKVHDVLVKQSKGPFLKQYLQRSVAPRALSSCQRSISNALSMFNSSLQIRVLRQVIASAEPALSTMIQPDSIAIEPQHMIETLYSVLESGQQSSLARDAEELRQRLLKANSNDASEVLSLLEVERDQVPEAIQTLQRALESETAPGHLTPVTTDEEYSLVDAPDDASASLLPSPLSRSAKSRQRSPSATQSTPDQTSFLASNATAQRNVLDREFLEMAIDSLRRSGGVETNLPKWTITRYEIDLEERIGRSEVYKGVWRGRAVAVKLMPKTTSKHMFLQLVSMWETLEHPNVLEFLGALSTSNDPPWFVVTPYYSNGSLVTYLHGLSSLESADTLGMIHNIAEGMAYLHNRDVLHGELRAENVLVDNRGRCIVTNFAQWEMKAEAYRLSRVLPPHDSLRWQAPELMYFESGVTRAADVYAFAITCFEILTKGALPWPEADDYTVRDFVLGNNMRPKLPLQQVWSTELATILHACWHRQPEVRPSFTRIEREVRELRARFGTSVREDFAPSEPPSASMLAISKSQSPLSAVPRLTSSVVSTNDRLPSLVLESDVNSSYTPQSLGNALVPSDEHGQDLRNERVYRMFLTHEFHSSLTLPLWTPSQIPVGAVGYHNKAGGGEFLVLFNATDPTQSSGGFARGIPRLSAFGRASQASERQDKRPVAQRGLDTVRSLFRGSPRGPPESRYARRYSAPLHAGRRSAHLFTESTVYRFIEDLATAKGWFKANVDRILALYGAEHRIVKEDLYLVTGTLEAKEYALFVSHDHPDGQVDFNVFEAPSRGHPWGEFTFSFDRKSTPLGEPQEDEQRSLTHAEKVSKCGDNRWLSLLLARLRFKPDQSEPTLL
ncbi:hypothetical protein BD414DRAFT_412646 [Trametes punicea]|nr:hypothetical protein BD414DRAFT_412646 [Trametes punicea]